MITDEQLKEWERLRDDYISCSIRSDPASRDRSTQIAFEICTDMFNAFIAEVRRLRGDVDTLMDRIAEERDERIKVEARAEMLVKERDEARRNYCKGVVASGGRRQTISLYDCRAAAYNLYGEEEADRLFPKEAP